MSQFDAMVRVGDGRWVPAIPEPYPLMLRLRCVCGRKFWTRVGYQRHYILSHVYYDFVSALRHPTPETDHA